MLARVSIHILIHITLIALAHAALGQSTHEETISQYRRMADEYPAKAIEYELKALELSLQKGDVTNIVISHTRIGSHYRQHSDYAKAISHFENAVSTGNESHRHLLGQAYLELGIARLRMAELDLSEQALMQCLEISQENGDQNREASVYNMLGNVYKDRNNYQGAVEWYLKGLKIFETLGDSSGLTQVVSNVGNMQYLLGNYDKALVYAQTSLEIAEKINQQSSIAYSNRLLGRIFRKQAKYDEAIRAYDKAIRIYQSIGAKRDVGETFNNSANIYFERGEFQFATARYRDALEILRTIHDSVNMAYSYTSLAQAYLQLNDSKSALQYFDSAKLMAERKRLLYIMLDVHYYRSEIFAQASSWRKAYDEYVAYASLEDSLTAKDNRLAAQELENRYQNEKKEDQIRALQASNELTTLKLNVQKTQRNYLIGIALMTLVMAGLLYSRYRTKVRTAEKLAELDRLKTQFFTDISHEFRTPLSLIIGPLSMLVENETDRKHREQLELVSRNANRLSSLIDQLLDLSRIEAGHVTLKITRFNAIEAIRLIAANFQSLAQTKEIIFDITLNLDDEVIYADRDKLEKILLNLLSNAFKYTGHGGNINLACERDGGTMNVTVQDNGAGISREHLPRVFDRFFRSETAGEPGSGIGLALCQELVTLHKGTIAVESDEGEGCTFRVRIPVSRSFYTNSELIEENEITNGIEPGPMTQQQLTTDALPVLLIAEDNDEMRSFIRGVCSEEYRVIVAENGVQAFDLTAEHIPDIIITDVMMPHLDGKGFCEKVRQHPATSHIPIIMLTAKADVDSKIEGLDTGADDYLAKPFHPGELLARLRNLIRQRRLLQDAFRMQVVIEPQQLQSDNPTDKFMASLLQLLQRNYADPNFGVDQLADGLHISRMQLNRKLKAITGGTPGELIRKYRLQHAENLLRSGTLQVSEVAFRTGFNNLSNFSKVFREYSGYLPSEFMDREKSTPTVSETSE